MKTSREGKSCYPWRRSDTYVPRKAKRRTGSTTRIAKATNSFVLTGSDHSTPYFSALVSPHAHNVPHRLQSPTIPRQLNPKPHLLLSMDSSTHLNKCKVATTSPSSPGIYAYHSTAHSSRMLTQANFPVINRQTRPNMSFDQWEVPRNVQSPVLESPVLVSTKKRLRGKCIATFESTK